MYETSSFLKHSRATRSRVRDYCTRPPAQKRKEVLASAEGASGEIWEILLKCNKKIEEIRPLLYETDSFLQMLQNHALANARCLGATMQKRKGVRERRRRERRKLWRFCFKFKKKIEGIQPLAYETGSFLKALQNHALTNARSLRAPGTQEDRGICERRRRERRKFGSFCSNVTRKSKKLYLYCDSFLKMLQNHALANA